MPSNLTSMLELELETPRGQLDALWRNTMELASAGGCRIVTDEWNGKLHKLVDRVKDKADNLAGETGVYPDAFVLRFLKRIAWATERLRHSNTGTTGRLD